MAQRSRSYRREQRSRMALKRLQQYRARFGQKSIEYSVEMGWRTFSPGEFHNEQPYMGCRKARCHMCHGDKLLDPRRTREARAWQAAERHGWEGDEAPLVIEMDAEYVYDERGFCMAPEPMRYSGVWTKDGYRLGDLSDIDHAYDGSGQIYEYEDDYGYRGWVSADDHYIR